MFFVGFRRMFTEGYSIGGVGGRGVFFVLVRFYGERGFSVLNCSSKERLRVLGLAVEMEFRLEILEEEDKAFWLEKLVREEEGFWLGDLVGEEREEEEVEEEEEEKFLLYCVGKGKNLLGGEGEEARLRIVR